MTTYSPLLNNNTNDTNDTTYSPLLNNNTNDTNNTNTNKRISTSRYTDSMSCGFIDLSNSKNNVPFTKYDSVDKNLNYTNNSENIIPKSLLSGVFFSKKNINNIQNNIQTILKNDYNYEIDKQSNDELFLVMRSYYLQYSLNHETKIKEQINLLNKKVQDYCVSNILTNIKQYLGYLEDIQHVPDTIEAPISTNIVGDKNNYDLTDKFLFL